MYEYTNSDRSNCCGNCKYGVTVVTLYKLCHSCHSIQTVSLLSLCAITSHYSLVRTLHKPQNVLVLVLRLGLLDNVNLVLKDDDVLEFHDLNGSKVL